MAAQTGAETARTSPPSRGAWIEMLRSTQVPSAYLSPPSRGAWIEMSSDSPRARGGAAVAPLAGGVD